MAFLNKRIYKNSSSDWLVGSFLFGTEIWGYQWKKPPCISNHALSISSCAVLMSRSQPKIWRKSNKMAVIYHQHHSFFSCMIPTFFFFIFQCPHQSHPLFPSKNHGFVEICIIASIFTSEVNSGSRGQFAAMQKTHPSIPFWSLHCIVSISVFAGF